MTNTPQPEKPPVPNMAGKVMTVRGVIDPSELGLTLIHEHLFADLRVYLRPNYYTPATDIARWDGNQKLTLDNLHLAREGKPIPDTVMYADEKLAIAESIYFRDAGGSTIVDLANNGLRRDPLALRRVSYATGVNVIMGSGWYIERVHPADMDQRTVEVMTEEIIRDVVVGAGGTDIRSGIIGEIGVDGYPISPNEIKSVKAAARASKATGAAISLHRSGVGRDEKLRVLNAIAEEGADLTRTVMGHSDLISLEPPLMRELMGMGPYIEFDFLGKLDVPLTHRPAITESEALPRTAEERRMGAETGARAAYAVIPVGWALGAVVAEAIVDLIQAGYEDQILLSHDCFTKTNFRGYGGTGWAFILEKFLPHLLTMGVTEAQINKFMVENPKRVLTFVAPQ